MSATPSDEPSCWLVYCNPPASLRPDSSTDDWTTLPNWEIIRPMPTPSTAIPMANPALESVGLIVVSRMSEPISVTMRPLRTIVRTAKRFESRAPTAAVANIVIEMGAS